MYKDPVVPKSGISVSVALAEMKQILLILAILGVAFAAPQHNATFTYHPPLGGRIVGGEAADIHDFPWQVALLRNGAQICGGSIIAPRVILTAAHCVVSSVIPAVSQLNIRSGSALHNSGGLRVAVQRIVTHPSYQDCLFCPIDYDIAVLHLASNAVATGVPAAAIGLWDESTAFPDGTYGVVSGWGTTREGGSGTTQLRSVEVPIVNQATCRAAYGSVITNRILCAGYANGGKDACQGDSGGPYVVLGKLAGVVSFGMGCARPGYPGAYSSVPGYRTWIRTNAGL